jgi:hypothetical protein
MKWYQLNKCIQTKGLPLLRLLYIGEVCTQKHQQQQHVTITTALALANRNDPICVAHRYRKTKIDCLKFVM